MKKRVIRLIENERLVSATHWLVFGLGALTLAVSVSAVALNLLLT